MTTTPSPSEVQAAINRIRRDAQDATLFSDSDAVHADLQIVLDAAKAYQDLLLATGLCRNHQPDGGARSCLVCGIEQLSHALSRISYLCGKPNEMGMSEFDTHGVEEEVVKQVESLSLKVTQLREYVKATEYWKIEPHDQKEREAYLKKIATPVLPSDYVRREVAIKILAEKACLTEFQANEALTAYTQATK